MYRSLFLKQWSMA